MNGPRAPWTKTVGGDFDRIDLSSVRGSDWLKLEMRVGSDVERIVMELRSDEAVRDLHYALGRYLAHLDDQREQV
jgi:hypothetical protein